MSTMRKLATITAAVVSVLGVVALSGCGGGGGDAGEVPTAPVEIMLVDAPASEIAELHVGIQRVQLMRRAAPQQTVLGADDLPDDIDLIAAGRDPVVLGVVDVPVGHYTSANLEFDREQPTSRVQTEDGTVHPLTVVAPAAPATELLETFHVVENEPMTLLFDVSAAASVRQAEGEGGWVFRPRVYARYIERGVQFGGLRGTVREKDGAPLVTPPSQVLGVFLEDADRRQTMAFAEVCCEDGSFAMPKLVPDRYRLIVQYATTDWNPVGEPLAPARIMDVVSNVVNRPVIEIDL